MADTPTRCPKCGQPPTKIDRVREPVTSGFGDVLPEPRIVQRATCPNGHQWFAADEQPGCQRCRNRDQAVLQQVGEREYEEFFGGKGRETRTHFVCQLCGAQWVRIVESGAGGHGDNWNPE